MNDIPSTPTPPVPITTLRAGLAALTAAQCALSQAAADTAAALPAAMVALGLKTLTVAHAVHYVSSEGDFHGTYESLVLDDGFLVVVDDHYDSTLFDDLDTAVAADILMEVKASDALEAAEQSARIIASYPDGKYPDCGTLIPKDVAAGQACSNCGHVLTDES